MNHRGLMSLLIISTLAFVACGDDGGGGGDPPDAATAPAVDAAPASDATLTACGTMNCNWATHICVNDIDQNEACVELPTDCDDTRTCETCGTVCTDTTCFNLPDDNKIACH